MTDEGLDLLDEVAAAVARSLEGLADRGPSGLRDGQYALDLLADAAALEVLAGAGVGVLSEESGLRAGSDDRVVVIDPVDGSTNASRGVPWYACALCLVDGNGAAAALVVNLASGERWWARRGEGAWRDGRRLAGSGCTDVAASILALNGLPPAPLGSAQSRVLGSAALDLCAVAGGVFDGYVDCVDDQLGVWDYAASALICAEAGVPIVDLWGRDLLVLDHVARRTPVAAATPALLEPLLTARRAGNSGPT